MVEDQRTIYDVYIAACSRIADVLERLQRFIDHEIPYRNMLTRQAGGDAAGSEKLFTSGTVFKAEGAGVQALVRDTLDNKLVKENPVPKEIILEEPKKGGAPEKKDDKKAPAPAPEQAAKDKKKAKVKNVEVIQLEPSQEIMEVAAHVYT